MRQSQTDGAAKQNVKNFLSSEITIKNIVINVYVNVL